MQNKMAEVAKLLGVEMGERFKISDGTDMDFMITESGVLVFNGNEEYNSDFVLAKLLKGEFEIVRPPFKPKKGDRYFCWVETSTEPMDICVGAFDNHAIDFMYCETGNCYRTRAEAEADKHRIEAIFNKWRSE